MPEKKTDGKRKAAVLLVALGPEKAAQVMKHLDEETVEQLVVEIANIGRVSPEEKKQVLEEFLSLAKAKEMISEGGIEYAKKVLEKAFGPERARKIIERLTSSLQVKPFSFVRDTDPVQLVNFLQSEHPQTIAVVLSYLDPPVAAQILGALPEELQTEVLKRIALLERTSPEVVKEIERNLEKKISGFVSRTFSKVGGIDTAAEIMNSLDRTTEKKIMDKLVQETPELADEIRRRMFVFEDILKLDDRSFLLHLHEQFGDRMGEFTHVGPRSSFPLILKHASTITGHRAVLIGNAAQALHPVAGQGFNLGLRDAWELASEISRIPSGTPGEPGSTRMLAAYSRRRQSDKRISRLFTDSLVKLFTADLPLVQTCSGMGLAALDNLPPARRLIAHQMIFGTKGWFIG